MAGGLSVPCRPGLDRGAPPGPTTAPAGRSCGAGGLPPPSGLRPAADPAPGGRRPGLAEGAGGRRRRLAGSPGTADWLRTEDGQIVDRIRADVSLPGHRGLRVVLDMHVGIGRGPGSEVPAWPARRSGPFATIPGWPATTSTTNLTRSPSPRSLREPLPAAVLRPAHTAIGQVDPHLSMVEATLFGEFLTLVEHLSAPSTVQMIDAECSVVVGDQRALVRSPDEPVVPGRRPGHPLAPAPAGDGLHGSAPTRRAGKAVAGRMAAQGRDPAHPRSGPEATCSRPPISTMAKGR